MGTLTFLAEARQAPVSAETLRIYALHLADFSDEDVEAAASRLALTRRQEGETAFPDLATLIEAVKSEGRNRRIAEAARARESQRLAEEQDRIAHPENYVSMGEIVGGFYESKGMNEAVYATENDPAPLKNPRESIMAALSERLDCGHEYEPALVAEIQAWRQERGA